MKLQRKAALPLSVGHLEQVDLRHRAGDVEQGIDPAESRERLIDDRLRRGGIRQVGIDDQRLCAGGLHGLRRLVQIGAIARDQHELREITGKAYCGRAADALAGTGDNGNRLRHARYPHLLLLAHALVHEIADDLRDLGAVRLQREVAGVEEVDLCIWNVALERFGARRKEERIVLAPHRQERRLVGAEIALE